MGVITQPMLGLKLNHVSKKGPMDVRTSIDYFFRLLNLVNMHGVLFDFAKWTTLFV